MDVVCVGDCGVDHYLPSGEKRFGGITANFARHARNTFRPTDAVRIVSCVGDDDGGELVLSALQGSGIESHISQLPGATPVQYIEVGSNGEKNFVRYDEGVLRDFGFGADERKLIGASDLLVAPVYLQIVDLYDDLMSIQTRGLVAVDFADFLQHPDFACLERHIRQIDIGFFGLTIDDDDSILRLKKLAADENKLFIVTLGEHGSRAFQGARVFECPAVPVNEVVDTTGAGDAYAAAFLANYCHESGVQRGMEKGAALAARVVAHAGSYVLPDLANRE